MSLMRPYKDLNTEISKLSDEYTGIVEDNNDPKGLQRIKVRIKELHGNLETPLLPWCIKDNNASTSNQTGTVCIPSIGQTVRIKFDNGDIYSPRYSTGLVNIAVPEYLQGGVGFFDFNNFIKISPEGIKYKDANNNEVILDANGIQLLDKNGNKIIMNSSGISIIDKNGKSIVLSASGIANTGDTTINGNNTITGNQTVAGTSHSTNYDAHTHTGNLGNPTSPPDK